jgi:hypothetical protein
MCRGVHGQEGIGGGKEAELGVTEAMAWFGLQGGIQTAEAMWAGACAMFACLTVCLRDCLPETFDFLPKLNIESLAGIPGPAALAGCPLSLFH